MRLARSTFVSLLLAIAGVLCLGPRPAGGADPVPAGGFRWGEVVVPENPVLISIAGQQLRLRDLLESLTPELEALAAATQDGKEFNAAAQKLVREHIHSIAFGKLLVREADARLSPAQAEAIVAAREKLRSALIQEHGKGDEAAADRQLIKTTGRGLAATVDRARVASVIELYKGNLAQSQRMTITPAEIERYHRDNLAEFGGVSRRTFRMIRTADAESATAIEAALRDKPFAEVARDRRNSHRAAEGGLTDVMEGDSLFGAAELNKAALALKKGEQTRRININDTAIWLYLEDATLGEAKLTDAVRAKIEQKLRDMAWTSIWKEATQRIMKDVDEGAIRVAASAMMGPIYKRYRNAHK